MAILKEFGELVVTSRPGQAAGGPLHEMRENSVRCLGPHGLHRMAYTEWGDPANPRVLVCVHGLTRNGRDFDVLANALASDYRVVCPDVVGRGRSDRMFFSDDYAVPVYANDMMTLIARLGVDSVLWLGTSMGGLIGMFLSSLPGSPISRLVLNDVGPAIGIEALQRIGEYLGKSPDFADLAAAEAYVRVVCAPFGALTDAQWRYMTVVGTRAKADGGFEMNYDRAIAEPYQKAFLEAKEINLWPMYEGIRCPTLVLRGAQSDILSHEVAVEMTGRGPKATLVEVPGVGHAPMFLEESQVRIVQNFLLAAPG
ncbi:MAG: alpha/beta hydrolase [Candidatus Accumulibacter sp.]|uniref:Alpha/beta hydrolase n=2 Tax=Candidatus Accumulibacter TaxID=327159 RepID=A0A935UFM4_9PROT|nr:alpha/beta hydrolase [Candidatus Accumulibacter proximus]MBL8375270.1 alpha/beta hydrolase [Accumulibacter sp.]